MKNPAVDKPVDDALALAGRVLIAVLFLPSALGKIGGFAKVSAAMAAKGLPLSDLLLVAAVAVEILCSIAIVLGWRVRWPALALAAFTLVAGAVFHDFWNLTGPAAMPQQQAFFKNVGLIGGLLLLASRGPGRWSLDARRAANPAPPALQPERT